MKKLLLISTSVVSMALTSFAVSIDTSETAAWNGWMNVFENNGGAAGGYQWGSGWGVADLNSSYAGGTLISRSVINIAKLKVSPNSVRYRNKYLDTLKMVLFSESLCCIGNYFKKN